MCPPLTSLPSVGPRTPSFAKGTPGIPSLHRLVSGAPIQGPPHWVYLYLAQVGRGTLDPEAQVTPHHPGALTGSFSFSGSHFPCVLLAEGGATLCLQQPPGLWRPPPPPEHWLSMAAEMDFPSVGLANTSLEIAIQASPFQVTST